MALTINHNFLALQRQAEAMQTSRLSLHDSLTKLNSTHRINSARYDLSVHMNAKLASYQTNARFTQDTINVLQTAEGGLNETHSMLERMRALATQAASGHSAQADLEKMQQEFTDLTDGITNMGANTSYGRDKLLDGSLELVTQTPNFGGQNRSIKIEDMRAEALGISDLSIQSTDDARNALTRIDQAIEQVSKQRAALGEEQGIVSRSDLSKLLDTESVVAKPSRITDYDWATESINLTKARMLQQAGTAMLAQANSLPQIALSLLR